jgi:hypothetical protein
MGLELPGTARAVAEFGLPMRESVMTAVGRSRPCRNDLNADRGKFGETLQPCLLAQATSPRCSPISASCRGDTMRLDLKKTVFRLTRIACSLERQGFNPDGCGVAGADCTRTN